MDPNQHMKLLELYTHGISTEALKDAEKFLESSLPLNRSVTKERLLEKALYEEQLIEDNRRVAEVLRKENAELKNKMTVHEQTLRTLQRMREEREELQKKRKDEVAKMTACYRAMDEIVRLKQETEELREECMKLREKWDAEDKARND